MLRAGAAGFVLKGVPAEDLQRAVRVAAELFVSEGTVKTHINHLFTKLRLRDRAAAVVFAFDHGLVKRPG